MSDRDLTRLAPGAKLFSGETPTAAELREFHRTHCVHCGRPFGMTRRRHAGKQFCSARCVAEYTAEMRERAHLRSHWYDFLVQRR